MEQPFRRRAGGVDNLWSGRIRFAGSQPVIIRADDPGDGG